MKKLMAFLLVLVLVLATLPMTAMATSYDVDSYDDFVKAIKAGATEINITDDFEVNMPEPGSSNNWNLMSLPSGCTINGNGHTIKIKKLDNGTQNGKRLFATNGGCTIKDIIFDAKEMTTAENIANLRAGDTMENVTILGGGKLTYGVTVGVPYGKEGTVTLKNCTFENIKGHAIYNNGGKDPVTGRGDGGDPVVLKISDSTFEDCGYAVIMREAGSEFIGNTVDSAKLNMTADADTTIKGNTFEGTSRIKFYNDNSKGNFTDNKILGESYFEFSDAQNSTDLDGNYFADPETALKSVGGVKDKTIANRAYLITVANVQNGIVTAPEMAKAGEKVTLDVIAAPGYALKAIATNVQSVAVANNAFTMPASDITVTATFEAASAVEEPEAIPETGDGMGLFVFAGLALISMLGMAMLKKREQF